MLTFPPSHASGEKAGPKFGLNAAYTAKEAEAVQAVLGKTGQAYSPDSFSTLARIPDVTNKHVHYTTAFLQERNGKIEVKSPDSTMKAALETVLGNPAIASQLKVSLQQGIALQIKCGDPEQLKQFMESTLEGLIEPIKKQIDAQHPETVSFALWPVLEQMLNGQSVHHDLQPIEQGIETLNLYGVASGDSAVASVLNKALAPTFKKLNVLQVTQANFVRTDLLKEAGVAATIGTLSGFFGEGAVEKYFHGEKSTLARTGLLALINLTDNIMGSYASVSEALHKRGGKLSSLFKENKDILGRTAFSAGLGTASGFAFTPPQAFMLSKNSVHPLDIATAGVTSLGSALSVPMVVQQNLPDVTKTLHRMKDLGWLNTKTQHDIAALAKQEYFASIGNTAAVKAFTLAPFVSGAIKAAQFLGVPRKYVNQAYVSISPAMENLGTVAFLFLDRARISSKLKAFETAIVTQEDAHGKPIDVQQGFRQTFAGKTSAAVGGFFTQTLFFWASYAALVGASWLYYARDKKRADETRPTQAAEVELSSPSESQQAEKGMRSAVLEPLANNTAPAYTEPYIPPVIPAQSRYYNLYVAPLPSNGMHSSSWASRQWYSPRQAYFYS
jgi:hypothetical protein